MSFCKLGAPLLSSPSCDDSKDRKTGQLSETRARSNSAARRARKPLLSALMLGALGLGLASTSGCGDESDGASRGGNLSVPYLLGNSLKCADLNVTNIRVVLENPSLGAPITKNMPCDNSNKVMLQNIPVGQWSVAVEAIDSMGVITMDNRNQNPLPVAEVLGTDITSTASTINLSAVPAHVFLRWNTQYDNCASLGIETFRVSAWDASGATQLGMASVGCLEQTNAPDGYRRLPDPSRSIQGSQVQSLSVLPVDSAGSAVGSPVRFNLLRPPGAGYSVFLSLICDKTAGCRQDGDAIVNAMPSQSTDTSTGSSTSTATF